ncbi:hypothetical protein [Hoeflea sp.]|uniref:hypothetical protein n=1 Tax=Hoeflea sp. TaxID=1940281 RepID=UPI0037493ECD
MSDIGIITLSDIIILVLAGCAPGLVIGAMIGAWRGLGAGRGRRILGALVYGLAGFGLAFAGWWLYFRMI